MFGFGFRLTVQNRASTLTWLLTFVVPIALLPALGFFFIVYLAPVPPNVRYAGSPPQPGPLLSLLGPKPSASIFLLVFAALLGVTGFFSPCCFPLLPGHLTRNVALSENGPSKGRVRGVATNGLAAAAGLFLFVALLGSAIALLGTAFGQSVRIITQARANTTILDLKILAGVGLVSLGILGLSGRRSIVRAKIYNFLSRKPGNSNEQISPGAQMFSYGFGYGALGTACSGPMIATIALVAAGLGLGALAAVGGFLLFAIIQSLLMIGVSLLVAISPSSLRGSAVGASGHRMMKVAWVFQVGTGIFIILVSILNVQYVQFLFG